MTFALPVPVKAARTFGMVFVTAILKAMRPVVEKIWVARARDTCQIQNAFTSLHSAGRKRPNRKSKSRRYLTEREVERLMAGFCSRRV
jgi:hypothetical protein